MERYDDYLAQVGGAHQCVQVFLEATLRLLRSTRRSMLAKQFWDVLLQLAIFRGL